MITWRGRPFTAPVHRVLLSVPHIHPAIPVPTNRHVLRVFDGDCFSTIWDRRTIYVRIWGADAPECPQPYGLEAKRALQAILKGAEISLLLVSTDQFHRRVCRVSTPSCPDVSLELLRRGLAWHEPRFAPNATAYAQAEAAARRARLGLWQDPKPTAPWDWRKSHKVAAPPLNPTTTPK